jgi:hypothetical protein
VYAVVPDVFKVLTAPHIYASIFSCRHLRCYCRYHMNSMRIILQTWCQIQCITPRLCYVTCGSGHIQSVCCSAYSDLYILLKVGPLLLEISRQFNARYAANLVPKAAHIVQFTLVNCGSGHIQCIYSSAYSDFNIHLNVSALLLYKSRQFNACYTANLVPDTAHIVQFTLCELWCRTYTKYLQFN